MSAPFGYVVNDKYVNIFVDTDTAFETDGDTNDAIITVEYSDAPAVGELTVENKGEVLDGFKGGLLASSYEKEFVYKEGSLAGAKIKVYAAEDIYTADNQKDADGNRIKYYSKGRPCDNSYNWQGWKGNSKESSSWTVQSCGSGSSIRICIKSE